eukprot:1139325-Pelagomonas_calceolata.AAC.2
MKQAVLLAEPQSPLVAWCKFTTVECPALHKLMSAPLGMSHSGIAPARSPSPPCAPLGGKPAPLFAAGEPAWGLPLAHSA